MKKFPYLLVAMLMIAPQAKSQELPGPSDFVPNLPADCHTIYHSAPGIADKDEIDEFLEYQVPSFETLHKYDVFCSGEVISINSNLYTNGGSIYILADRLELNATIDTGVYRPFTDRMMFSQPTNENGDERFTSTYGTPYRDTLGLIQRDNPKDADSPNYLYSFRAYYEIDQARREAGGLPLLRRMPDGITPPTPYPLINNPVPPAIRPPTEGLMAASYNSGHVFLYVNEITISDDLETSIDTSGLDGGIGGAAAPDRCVGFPSGDFSCVIVSAHRPGINTPGSAGSKGGSIIVHMPDPSEYADHPSFKIAGGRYGRSTKLRSPKRSDSQNTPLNKDLSDFELEGEHEVGQEAQAGELVLVRVQSYDLLREFILTVEEREGLVDYSSLEFARRARLDSSLSVYRPSQFIQAKLDKFYRDRMWYLIPAYGYLLTTGLPGDISNVTKPSIFCGHPEADLTNLQTATYLSLIQSVCGLPTGKTGLDEYFVRRGGYFALNGQVDPVSYLSTERQTLMITWSAQDWAEAINQLATLNETTHDIFHSMEKREIQQRLGQINSEIGALQAAITAAEEGGGFLEMAGQVAQLASAVSTMGSGAAAFTVAYDLLMADGENVVVPPVNDREEVIRRFERFDDDDRSSQLKKLAGAGKELYDGFVLLDASLAQLNSSPSTASEQAQIEALRAEAEELRQLLAKMARDLASKKAELNTIRDQQLMRGLKARLAFGSLERSTAQYLNELLAASVISYVNDPNRDEERLSRNLNQLAQFIVSYPFQEGSFEIGRIDQSCGETRNISKGEDLIRENENCVRVHASDEDLVLTGWIRTPNGTLFEIPMYRIERWGGNHALPIHAINDYKLD